MTSGQAVRMPEVQELPTLVLHVASTVRTVMGEVRPRLVEAALSGRRGESVNLRHADNFLSEHDLWMHDRYRELLARVIPAFVYASEEADPEVVGPDPDPDLVVLVDPLDTSELAVRALHGYTHVLVYSRQLARPVAAVVGDIFHHVQLYVAGRDDQGVDGAWLVTADDDVRVLTPSRTTNLRDALVMNYSMRPRERFSALAAQHAFLQALAEPGEDGRARGRIGVDFGSVSLCHVAAGFTDAVVEFAKGFAVWDLAPGQYVLHAAGGVVVGLDGAPLPLDQGLHSQNAIAEAMNGRRRFVAAATTALAAEITSRLAE